MQRSNCRNSLKSRDCHAVKTPVPCSCKAIERLMSPIDPVRPKRFCNMLPMLLRIVSRRGLLFGIIANACSYIAIARARSCNDRERRNTDSSVFAMTANIPPFPESSRSSLCKTCATYSSASSMTW